MSFYQQIAPYYHHIFKINDKQIDFVKSTLPTSDSKLLDIGCGIGTLSLALSNYYQNVVGIDMDAEMIRVAKTKAKDALNSVQFHELSMLKLDHFLAKHSIDGIICFGNTLVHLNSLSEINNFLQQSKAVLKPNGKLLLQIVNYDKILVKNIRQLPTIENDEIIFERNYNYHSSGNKIDFNTRLTIKSTQQIIENSIPLLPLLKEQLASLLNKAGFRNCSFYGNFNMEAHSIDSPALIIAAE
ncbi:class I SAM-dependent methyltransferase [Arenibacter latericius]|uniref:class I SAM-dependent methyltransferase n=1 Tax=Arenibacter latericius TaxID=86104 RepID=UPI0004091B26|nr:class I SAM-dependent methyltransferase [Arenibacter latericius]MDX1365396.1 class I SAM-dependent methyltransferase [Arenibacter latericius]